jgi:hypothetical protein
MKKEINKEERKKKKKGKRKEGKGEIRNKERNDKNVKKKEGKKNSKEIKGKEIKKEGKIGKKERKKEKRREEKEEKIKKEEGRKKNLPQIVMPLKPIIIDMFLSLASLIFLLPSPRPSYPPSHIHECSSTRSSYKISHTFLPSPSPFLTLFNPLFLIILKP